MTIRTFATKAQRFAGAATVALMLAAVPASAATMTFTDQSAFEAAFGGNVIIEDFNGAASDFGADSTGNPIGSGQGSGQFMTQRSISSDVQHECGATHSFTFFGKTLV